MSFRSVFTFSPVMGSDINSSCCMENLSATRDKVAFLLFSDERRQIKFAHALHRDSFSSTYE